MEEFLLDPFLARQELHVINQQHIRLSAGVAEPREFVLLEALDVLVREFFR